MSAKQRLDFMREFLLLPFDLGIVLYSFQLLKVSLNGVYTHYSAPARPASAHVIRLGAMMDLNKKIARKPRNVLINPDTFTKLE